MNRKWMFGIGAGLLVTATMILVGVGAYRAGERNSGEVVVAEVLGGESTAGRTVILQGDDWGGHDGFFPGFFIFPLVVIGILLLCASRRRWYGPRYCSTDGGLDEWHRRAHADMTSASSPQSPSTPPSSDT